MYFDTHTHIQFKVFENSIDDVIEASRKAGIKNIVAVGTELESSKRAVKLADEFQGIFAAVGIHPHHVFEHHHSRENLENHLRGIEELLNNPKVIAIGEVGMDRHHYQKTKYAEYQITDEFIALQKILFVHQIKLAEKYQKSLIIHNREAVGDLLAVLKDNWSEVLAGRSVFHCCEPDDRLLDFAKEYGVFIGVDGDVTYDKDKQKFVKKIPLELLVLETDSPFLTPEPVRSLDSGSSLNIPANLNLIVQKIAEILKIDEVEIRKITFENSKKLFKV